MHIRDTARAGFAGLDLVPAVNPTGGRVFQTTVSDTRGAFVLHEATVLQNRGTPAPLVVAAAAEGSTSIPESAAQPRPAPVDILEQVFAELSRSPGHAELTAQSGDPANSAFDFTSPAMLPLLPSAPGEDELLVFTEDHNPPRPGPLDQWDMA
jgi:hypothetical protein